MNEARHVPVLMDQVLELLEPGRLDGKDGLLLDGTLGLGGHAKALLEGAGTGTKLLGMDKDPQALERAGKALVAFGTRVRLAHGSFARPVDGEAGDWLREQGVPQSRGLDGILLDLGVSSPQLDSPERGFSFQRSGPLDMRMDPQGGPSAADWLATADEADLVRVLKDYGEEHRARPLARAVLAAQKRGELKDTLALAQVARKVLGRPGHDGIHPATRLFQALRIEVNRELDDLSEGLPALAGLLAPGGRMAVISFHSLEDRQVKDFFRRESSDCVCPPGLPECRCGHKAWLKVLTPKPRIAGDAETALNPRARSAKLRVAQRL